jgi:hypothetical protein
MENKIKFNNKRPDPSEIRQFKNFDSALNSASIGSHAGAWSLKSWMIGSGIAVATILGIWFGSSLFSKGGNNKLGGNELAKNEMNRPILDDSIVPKKNWTLCNVSALPIHHYRIDDKKGMNIKTPHGSEIKVPAGAFGTNDSVVLSLKEIHRPDEVVLSGIPMDYKDETGDYIMSTAGMLSLEAVDVSGKKIVQLKKPIELAVKSDKTDPGCNFYQRDDKGWNFVHAAPAERKDGDKTEVERNTKQIQAPKKMELLEPKKLDEQKYAFSFDISKAEFPELNLMKNPIFEVIDGQNFNPDHYHVNWESIELIKEDGNYIAVLKRGSKVVKYKVSPALKAVDYEKAKKEYDALIKKQEKAEKEYQQSMRQLTSTSSSKRVSEVQRMASIMQTGVYNFDYIKKLDAYRNISKEVIVKNHKQFNTLYSYFKDGNQNIIISDSYGKLPLSNNSKTYLIATDYNGNIHMAEVTPNMNKDQIIFEPVSKGAVFKLLAS